MIGGDRLAKSLAGLIVGFGAVVGLSVSAGAIELPLENAGFTAPVELAEGAPVQRVELGPAGTSSINTIILSGSIAGSVGRSGVFPAYDFDAFVLDREGDIETAGNRMVLAGLSLGLIGDRARLADSALQLAALPDSIGAHFAAGTAGNIGSGTAPLDTFDGKKTASISSSDGFLGLGDGGKLALNFADILIGGGLYLIFGDVVGPDETFSLGVTAQVPLPGSVWLFMSALAILFYMSSQRDSLRS